MFRRGNADTDQETRNVAGGHQPERMEKAEFTMSSTPDVDQDTANIPGTDRQHADRVIEREQIDRRRTEWEEIQARFIDDPHRAVDDANQLVAETIDDITRALAEERGELEEDWSNADEVSTEDLRVVFQRYRSFLERLLSF